MSKLNRNIKILITANCISSIGDWLNILALMSLVVKLSDKSELLAILMIIRAIPKILLGPIVSGIIDRLNKKNTLLLTGIISSIIVLYIPFSNSIYTIFILSFLLSTVNIFMSPIINSIVPLIVEEDKLIYTNSIFSASSSFISILAPVISGLILTFSNSALSFYIDSFSFLIFCVLILFLKLNDTVISNLKNKYNFTNIMNISKKSFKYILKNPNLYRIFKGIFLVNMSMGIIYVSELIYLKNVLNIDPDIYGAFVSIVGIGILIGSLVLNKLQNYKLYSLFSFGIYIMGISIIIFSCSSKISLIVLCLIIEGIGECFFTTTSITIIQKNTDENNRASVLTFNDSLSKSAYILSMGISGLLLTIINVKFIVLLAGIISALYYFIWIKNK